MSASLDLAGRGQEIIIISWALTAIALIAVITRLYTRLRLRHAAGLDDLAISSAMVCSSRFIVKLTLYMIMYFELTTRILVATGALFRVSGHRLCLDRHGTASAIATARTNSQSHPHQSGHNGLRPLDVLRAKVRRGHSARPTAGATKSYPYSLLCGPWNTSNAMRRLCRHTLCAMHWFRLLVTTHSVGYRNITWL